MHFVTNTINNSPGRENFLNNNNSFNPYRLTHEELKNAIKRETLKLEELKRLYELEENILLTHSRRGVRNPVDYDSHTKPNKYQQQNISPNNHSPIL